MSTLNLLSLAGFFAFCALAWGVGGCRRPVPWRTTGGAVLLVFLIAAAVFLLPASRGVLVAANDLVLAALDSSQRGAEFLLGPLALGPGDSTAAGEPSIGFVLAGQVFPAVVFFSSLMALLHHLGLVEPVVRVFARLFRRTLGLSGAESLAASIHMFFGVETAAAVKPYLERMTRSELLVVLSSNLATAASTTLAIYVIFLRDVFPQIAGHLLSASLLSVPCAVLTAKLALPETDEPETLGAVPRMHEEQRADNAMAAISAGAWDGLRIAAGIGVILIAVLGLVGLADSALAGATGWLMTTIGQDGEPLTVTRLLGWAFVPMAWLLGVEAADVLSAARLLGQRVLLTEVVSYQELGRLAGDGQLSPRSLMILSYALCGFAHVGGVGIAVGGFGALAGKRLDDVTRLAGRALVVATIATLLTGALAGTFYHGQEGLLGLGDASAPPLADQGR